MNAKSILCVVAASLCLSGLATAHECVETTAKEVTVEYDIEDAGKPGVVWVALTSASNWSSHVLVGNGQWIEYRGGLYQPYGDYRSQGLPKSIRFVFSTEGIPVGWKINVGYGLESADVVAALKTANKDISESALNEINLKMIQREMINKERFRPTVRMGNCRPNYITPTDNTITLN